MISISLPAGSGSHRYVIFGSWLLGPYYVLPDSLSEFRHVTDQIVQDAGLFGEKGVINDQLEAKICLYSAYNDITDAPTSSYPDAITFKTKIGGVTYLKGLNMGIADDSKIGRHPSNSMLRTYSVCTGNGTKQITICSFDVVRTSPSAVCEITGARQTLWTTNLIGATMSTWTSSQKSGAVPASLARTFPWAWDCNVSAATVISMVKLLTDKVTPVAGSYDAQVGTPFSAPAADPLDAMTGVDSLLSEFEQMELPFEEKHYGVLASEASQTLNANDVNMIAFIRDLRDPMQLIPKLRNLTKLKTLAGNFLAVDYGILPTISDLKEIMEAVKGRKPHVDLHGFKTCTAGYSVSSTTDSNIKVDMTQRIKVAVTDEDSMLLQLVNSVESIGILPTFENLWDLIPYSFVLDWFIDVGDLLERVDSNLRLMRYDVKYATMSRKVTYSGHVSPTRTCPYFGTVEWVRYHRWVTGRCPEPPLFLATQFALPSHWLEAAALFIQRKN